MLDFVVNNNQTININSNEESKFSYRFIVEEKSSIVLKIEGNKEVEIQIETFIKPDITFSFLIINNNEETVKFVDTYKIENNSKATIAYSQLNNYGIVTNSNYYLLQQGAEIEVVSASISSQKNEFNQNTVHLAGDTIANINNYGIVLKNGICEMVVKNTINKGCHKCSTHQTSRLLTYDKTSLSKVLPILFIDDNDVVASHACSLGQPDEEQLYYLQSRGLTYQQALRLVSIGYLMPVSKIVDDEDINELIRREIEMKVNLYV